jgi:hypothetical protein
MAEISVKPSGDYIKLTTQDDNGQTVSVEMDRHQSFAVIMSIVQALENLSRLTEKHRSTGNSRF